MAVGIRSIGRVCQGCGGCVWSARAGRGVGEGQAPASSSLEPSILRCVETKWASRAIPCRASTSTARAEGSTEACDPAAMQSSAGRPRGQCAPPPPR
eukprot:7165706-Lingulodinium_polyedra.AAC.1